jgi:aspartate-semialdehyde dehydrogenase
MTDRKIVLIGGGYLLVQEILDRISQTHLPVQKVQIIGEKERVGEIHTFRNHPTPVTDMDTMYAEGYDAALLLSPVEKIKKLTESLVMSHVPFLDMSNVFEASEEIPVLLPESETFDRKTLPMIGIIPTRSPYALALILHELKKTAQWIQANVNSVQGAASHGSRKGMDELFDQTRSVLGFNEIKVSVFPQQLAFNAFHCSNIQHENNVIQSHSRSLIGRPDFVVSNDVVWGGFFVGIIGTIWLFSDSPIDIKSVEKTLEKSRALTLKRPVDSVLQIAGSDKLVVGDIAPVDDNPKCIMLRFAMDNLHVGLASTLTELFRKVWSDE